MKAPHNEEFIAWRDHPVTQFVLAACAKAADEAKAEWVETSWASRKADPQALIELITLADAYRALADTSYEGWCETMGVEPNVE